jgi:purine-binding chemotaxis protein CheW
VVGLNEEFFGVDMELVREFADIRGLTPIPCAPPHIVGNMNLRGNILTLVDIRGLLDMPATGTPSAGKVIVAALGDLSAGVLVDDVFDIAFLKPSDIWPVPSAVQKAGERYLKGTAPYGDRMMTILNLANILASEKLSVEEDV